MTFGQFGELARHWEHGVGRNNRYPGLINSKHGGSWPQWTQTWLHFCKLCDEKVIGKYCGSIFTFMWLCLQWIFLHSILLKIKFPTIRLTIRSARYYRTWYCVHFVTGPTLNGFMYSADADGRGHFYKKNSYFFCVFFVGIHWSTGPIGTSPRVRPFGSPPTHHDLMKIYWVYIANVGMVTVGTTTVVQRHLANVGPTYFCQPYANDVGHIGINKKWKYLLFDFLKGHLFSRCQIQN